MFASFANMMLVLGREQCHPDTGPTEAMDAVFEFRVAADRAFPTKWNVPNAIALTQFPSSSVWYGASKIISTTRNGTFTYTQISLPIRQLKSIGILFITYTPMYAC